MTFTSVNPHDPADVLGEWQAAGRGRGAGRRRPRRQRGGRSGGRSRRPAGRRHCPTRRPRSSSGRPRSPSLVVREVGKPLSEARGEVARGVAILRYYAQAALLPDGETIPAAAADQLLMARHVPVGVAALLTPWNFPVAIPLWKAAPSLAYGNATILKPSSAAAATGAGPGRDPRRLSCQPDVFQVVLGGAATARAADRPSRCRGCLLHRLLRGRQADQPPRRRARLPGAGGDGRPEPVDRAGRRRPGAGGDAIAYASMGYAGQKCTATSRVIVERAVYPQFRDRLAAAVERTAGARPGRREDAGRPGHRRRSRARPRWPRWPAPAAGC